jgi:hypothetical protein
LHRTDECRHDNAEGGAQDRDLHAYVRRLIKTPIQITQVVHVLLIVSTPSSPALTFVNAGLANISLRPWIEAFARTAPLVFMLQLV